MSQTLAHIAGRPIGPGQPPYVVAEMSGNHNGDIKRALDLITAAAEAGAELAKGQQARAKLEREAQVKARTVKSR